jgi:hypothetical protein
MTLLTLLLVIVMPAAPGDIYRCVGSDGKAGFQDKPCAGQPKAGKLKGGGSAATNPRELRAWLQQLREQSGTPRGQASPPRRDSFSPSTAPLPANVDKRLLSVCSGRFLDCASDDAARMDACVARTPSCAPGVGAGCCPRECVTRYQALRAGGAPLATAVQRALLDPDRPSCAAR